MKKYVLIILSLAVGSLYAQPISIDESKASITFKFLEDDVDGTIEGFDFTGDINLANLDASTISGSVEMKTLDTNNWLRNRHLRWEKYFNMSEFPKLKFESTEITQSDTTLTVTGMLEIKGIQKEVTFSFEQSASFLSGTAQINTQDFNISIHDERDQNKVMVNINLPYSVN